MISASGFCSLTDLARATESLNTPVDDSLLTQWTSSTSLDTFPSMSSGFIALPQGIWTLSTVLPLSSAISMDLLPKDPLVMPIVLLAEPFLMAPSRNAVADPATRNTSMSVSRVFLIFSTMSPWSSLYSLERCVIMGLFIDSRVSGATYTGPTVKSVLLKIIPHALEAMLGNP